MGSGLVSAEPGQRNRHNGHSKRCEEAPEGTAAPSLLSGVIDASCHSVFFGSNWLNKRDADLLPVAWHRWHDRADVVAGSLPKVWFRANDDSAGVMVLRALLEVDVEVGATHRNVDPLTLRDGTSRNSEGPLDGICVSRDLDAPHSHNHVAVCGEVVGHRSECIHIREMKWMPELERIGEAYDSGGKYGFGSRISRLSEELIGPRPQLELQVVDPLAHSSPLLD